MYVAGVVAVFGVTQRRCCLSARRPQYAQRILREADEGTEVRAEEEEEVEEDAVEERRRPSEELEEEGS